jgi:hypothetical protein
VYISGVLATLILMSRRLLMPTGAAPGPSIPVRCDRDKPLNRIEISPIPVNVRDMKPESRRQSGECGRLTGDG